MLRLDLAMFFHSIDHAVLLAMLRPRTPPTWWSITERLVRAPAHVEETGFRFSGDDLFTPQNRPHGLPIGNLTSQVWANLVLTPVDHLLASHLGLGTLVTLPCCRSTCLPRKRDQGVKDQESRGKGTLATIVP